MIVFDTDVLVEILLGNARVVQRAASVPASEQFVPVVAVEEIIRGRLNAIRQAEAGRTRLTVARSYELFMQSLADLQRIALFLILPRPTRCFNICVPRRSVSRRTTCGSRPSLWIMARRWFRETGETSTGSRGYRWNTGISPTIPFGTQ